MKLAKLIICVLLISVAKASAERRIELVQKKCGVDSSPTSGFYIDLTRDPSTGKQVGGPYVITFEPQGPGIDLGRAYAPDWRDIDAIVFVYSKDSKSGHLSFKVRRGIASWYLEPVGLIQRDCWKLGKKYLSDNNIRVRIEERYE